MDLGVVADSEKGQKIDWAEQSLSVLQEQVDDMQTALENTNGLDAQIEAIDTLNDSLENLKGGAEIRVNVDKNLILNGNGANAALFWQRLC